MTRRFARVGRPTIVALMIAAMPWLACAPEEPLPARAPAPTSTGPALQPGEQPRNPSMVLQPSDLPPPGSPQTAPAP